MIWIWRGIFIFCIVIGGLMVSRLQFSLSSAKAQNAANAPATQPEAPIPNQNTESTAPSMPEKVEQEKSGEVVAVAGEGQVAPDTKSAKSLENVSSAEKKTEGGNSLQPKENQDTVSKTLPEREESLPMDFSIKAADAYEYDPTGLRDPFKPHKDFRPALNTPNPIAGNNPNSGPLRPGTKVEPSNFEPLQRFDLEKLLVVGIVWNVKNPRAMVKDGNGTIHTVQLNTKMGRNNGAVAAIREGEVVVQEAFEEEGKLTRHFRILELKR